MTGDKPDERLRTPLQWAPGAGGGFTSGTPWERLRPESLPVTVQAEDADPGSLLNLYRRLIHLRRQNEALATGRLVPLTTGNAQVTAYLRRTGDYAVLVVANLGAAAVSGPAIGSGAAARNPRPYAPRKLLAWPPAPPPL